MVDDDCRCLVRGLELEDKEQRGQGRLPVLCLLGTQQAVVWGLENSPGGRSSYGKVNRVWREQRRAHSCWVCGQAGDFG